MTYPNRNNPYTFAEVLAWCENLDYYLDDPFLQKTLRFFPGDYWKRAEKVARAISPKASTSWRKMADKIARPENLPLLNHYDGHNHHIARIVRPHETELLERDFFSKALFSKNTPEWVKLIETKEVSSLIAFGDIVSIREDAVVVAKRWNDSCQCLFHLYQDNAVSLMEKGWQKRQK